MEEEKELGLRKNRFPLKRVPLLIWVVLITTALMLIVWKLPQRQASILKQRIESEEEISVSREKLFELENTTRENYLKVIQTVGGLGFILTGYFAWKNWQTAEKKREFAERNAEKIHELTVDEQIIERFSKAIDFLSESRKLETRLGGIYLLKNIAYLSPKDQSVVKDFLVRYLKDKSPLHGSSDKYRPYRSIDNVISIDIQVILDVIGQLQSKYDDWEKLNLEGAYLCGADLRGVSLSNAVLDGAYLRSTKISIKTQLNKKWNKVYELLNNNSEKQNIEGNEDLERANLSKSVLSEIDFSNTKLNGSIFCEANLERANFSNAELNGAIFYEANLEGANFSNAELEGAIFCEAVLCKVNFKEAHLNNATLDNANLKEANFKNVIGLSESEVIKTRNWDKAIYDEGCIDLLRQLACEQES